MIIRCIYFCINLNPDPVLYLSFDLFAQVGNVYVQFREEEQAANALRGLSGRYCAGRLIIVDFSPVTDFREATCRQYEESNCNRGGYCSFMHLKRIGRELRRELFGTYRGRHSRSRSRSLSPIRHYSYEDRAYGGRGYGRRYDDDDYYESKRRRHWSTSPDHRRGRARSPEGRRDRSPVREGSEERRAKFEQWNREREEQENANRVNSEDVDTYKAEGGNRYDHRDQWGYEGHQQRRQDGVYGY